MREEFEKYVHNYNLNDWKIKLKFKHSLRVADRMVELGKSLKLDKDDLALAEIIGGLHDIGRFEQLRIYDSFNDNKSIDHAQLGVKILFEDNFIEKFNVSKDNYNLIKKAILWHNKIKLPDDLDERESLFCKMIRDADKLDIFECYINGEFILEIKSAKISPIVSKAFLNNKVVDYKEMQTELDSIIGTLAFIYDLNYQYSIDYLLSNQIFEQILEVSKSEILEKYIKHALNYLKNVELGDIDE